MITWRGRWTSCLIAGSLAFTGCSHSRIQKSAGMDGEIVEAEGSAPYVSEDVPGSRAAALAAAQRSAVELVVGVYVTAKTRVDKAVAIENTILSKTSGYIKKYEVISEGHDGEWYKVKIRALVSTHSLHEDLDTLGLLKAPAVNFPRVTIMLREFVGENESADGAADRALTQQLLNLGFQVVQLPSGVKADDDAVQAAKTMNHQTAELVIAGVARAQSLGLNQSLGGMHSYRASITARVIETGTGNVVATLSQTASGLEATPELGAQKSLQKAAEALGPDLAALPSQLDQRAHVDVTITGLTSFAALSDFQKALAGKAGVKDLFLRSYAQEAGVADIDVLIDQITPQELADVCVKIGGAAWYVYHLEGRVVQISASAAGR